ncbi:MAG: T9SS type A sorting domain-containing protein [Bacteroidetes bacterium]|nr:T9SS type A sorting domain-containing protein [Bacteroidota bacterium]
MKNKILFLFSLSIFASNPVCSQKHDAKWMMGYSFAPWISFPALDFNYGYADTIGYTGYFNIIGASTSICNTQGLLQFYTNGIHVANRLNLPLANSVDFNLDSYTQGSNSLGIEQCVLTIPEPSSTTKYNLFHIGGTYLSGSIAQPLFLRMSTIDMSLQNGNGQMVVKGQVVLSDTLTYRTMQAVKHGNGRDWWVVIGEYNSDKFYSALVTAQGIDTIVRSGSGYVNSGGLIRGQSTFSPDGSVYVSTTANLATVAENMVNIYYFDRCTGIFTFKDSITFPTSSNSSTTGCAFSPSGQYLYVNTFIDLFQYDLWSAQFPNNSVHIATYDGFLDFNPVNFYRMQAAPDNKIYIVPAGATRFLGVINSPNQPDSTCNFVQHQLQLISYNYPTIPHFPYYKLGASIGSGCDTLLTQGLDPVAFSPDEIVCYYVNNSLHLQFQESLKANLNYSIFSSNGQLINNGRIKMGTGPNYSINDIGLSSEGLYIIKLWNEEVQFSKKFVVLD